MYLLARIKYARLLLVIGLTNGKAVHALSVLCTESMYHMCGCTLPELSVVSVCRRKNPSFRELTDTPTCTHDKQTAAAVKQNSRTQCKLTI